MRRMSWCDHDLDIALTKLIQIHGGQPKGSVKQPYDAVPVSGFYNDRRVKASRDSSRDGALPVASLDVQLTPGGELKESEDTKCILSSQPLSSELFHRHDYNVPGDGLSSQEREDLHADISSVLGVNDGYIDDDFGLGKLPPPYPGSEDKTIGEQLRGGSKSLHRRDIFAVQHKRAEVEKIVAQAVEIFWNLRRCGESWESVPVPASFLQEGENKETTTEPRVNTDIVTCSRRSYRHLLFELTGEILRDIYQYENEVDLPAWHKPVPRRQSYYKGMSPPTTVDVLLPVVQTAAVSILGLNGAVGKMRGKTVNTWSVRKKKDHVDAVLLKELQEEEADWISYNHDETAVKLQLTDTIFESLLTDTVDALNRIYTRR